MARHDEGQTQGDVFLPVRLAVWERAPILEHEARDASGLKMESAEIQDSKGESLFAIEDGELSYFPDEKKTVLVGSDLSDGESRVWTFLNTRATVADGPVSAGDKIGVVEFADLVFFAFTADSPSVPTGQNTFQDLPVNPLDVLDDLDALPLEEDMPELLSPSERKRLSERLTDQRGGLSPYAMKVLKVGGLVVGGTVLGALLVKAMK